MYQANYSCKYLAIFLGHTDSRHTANATVTTCIDMPFPASFFSSCSMHVGATNWGIVWFDLCECQHTCYSKSGLSICNTIAYISHNTPHQCCCWCPHHPLAITSAPCSQSLIRARKWWTFWDLAGAFQFPVHAKQPVRNRWWSPPIKYCPAGLSTRSGIAKQTIKQLQHTSDILTLWVMDCLESAWQ